MAASVPPKFGAGMMRPVLLSRPSSDQQSSCSTKEQPITATSQGRGRWVVVVGGAHGVDELVASVLEAERDEGVRGCREHLRGYRAVEVVPRCDDSGAAGRGLVRGQPGKLAGAG